MQLTRYAGKARRVAVSGARTTLPGFENANRQRVMSQTGAPSTTFAGQVIYKLKCGACGFEYGSNGCDVHKRRCPQCQDGAVGEPLRAESPSLFE
jgi:hypothetical protein